MSCHPPYCMGSSGTFCSCSCASCCPPTPCYKSWTYTYNCGNVAPCACIPPAMAPNFDQPIPDLIKEKEDYVFALALTVYGCTNYTITLSTTGCCLYGSGTSFKAIGAGTVSLTASSSPCGLPFGLSINGGGSSATVTDCQTVNVTITPPSTTCCCTLTSSAGTLLTNSNGVVSLIQRVKQRVKKLKQSSEQLP